MFSSNLLSLTVEFLSITVNNEFDQAADSTPRLSSVDMDPLLYDPTRYILICVKAFTTIVKHAFVCTPVASFSVFWLDIFYVLPS